MNTDRPSDAVAERAVLGSILIPLDGRDAFAEVATILEPADFFAPVNGRIFAAVGRLVERDVPPDLLTVRDELGGPGRENDVYLASLIDGVPDVGNVAHYARIVKEKANLRRMQALAESTLAAIARGEEPANEVAASLAEACFSVIDGSAEPVGFVSAVRASDDLHDRQERVAAGEIIGVAPGIPALDTAIVSFEPGDTAIVCGDTSHGKTQVCVWMAREMARAGAKVGFVSLEMPRAQVAARFVSQESGRCSYADVMRAIADAAERPKDFAEIVEADGRFRASSVSILDAADISLSALVAHVRRFRRRAGLDVVFVDYVQLVHDEGGKRNEEVARLSRGLKRLARTEKIPVILVSQFSRLDPRAEDKRPSLRRLMDSSQLEKDATVVIGTYWEHRDDPSADWGKLEISILKQRNGECGAHLFGADWRCGRFGQPYEPAAAAAPPREDPRRGPRRLPKRPASAPALDFPVPAASPEEDPFLAGGGR